MLDKLASIDEIKEVYFVYGVYDIIVKIEAENVDKIKEIVTWKIRRLDKVRSTVTMVTMGKN
ncbi:MAG: Lrp/AsnC ligand binding domain-containing protein [Candidatus Methanomethylicia archaeon]